MKPVLPPSPVAVAIIGAGPYGLSLAAHLREAGIPFRIFGRSMQSWKTQMPAGMKLKSDGFASDLSAGSVSFRLGDFCRENGRPYDDYLIPIAVEDFADYGDEFARRFVPSLESVDVTNVQPDLTAGARFRLTLASGETLLAENIVVATGLSLFPTVPEAYSHLPAGSVTHTADHRTFDRFAGLDVAVLGRGASALNAGVLLLEAGARPVLISRSLKVHLHYPAAPATRPWKDRLLHPGSPLGDSMRSWLASNFPGLFHALPGFVRRTIVYKHLGPAGGSALHGRIDFPMLLGWQVASSETTPAQRIRLHLVDRKGKKQTLDVDHLIAGTGFRIDLKRLNFLSSDVRACIRREPNGCPTLDHRFESSVPGLYFAGPAAGASFGPLLRFACGSAYASTHITKALARSTARSAARSAAGAAKLASRPTS